MTNAQKSVGLLALITKGLLLHAAQAGASTLGDRTAYIGMSDIGSGMECLRAAVAGKVNHSFDIQPSELDGFSHRGDMEHILPVLQRQLVLQRGHWQEAGIEHALTAVGGINYIPQLTISVKVKGVPIQAHIDFTLVWGGQQRPAVRIVELKSNANIPDTLYASYEAQLYGQVSLLAAYWSTPSFSVTDNAGQTLAKGKTFPEIAKQLFGIDLPSDADTVDIEGWVLSISMDNAKAFGPYQPNDAALQACLNKASEIWTQAQNIRSGKASLDDLPYTKGFHPLCDYCAHNGACPKFTPHTIAYEYDQDMRYLKELKAAESALKERIAEAENRIRKTFLAIAPNGEWVETSEYRFRVAPQAGRVTLDKDALINQLLFEFDGDENRVQNIVARASKQGQAYTRLNVSPINKTKHA